MALQPGEIIDGKYRIVKLIGEGGMGAVYLGENTRIKRKVAIKVLHASVAEKVEVVARFEREAQAAGRIGSEHIVEVLDLGSLPSNERFMVMEYLEGEDLTSRIKSRKRLTPHECIPILDQVLEGLGAAHEAQIVHRDLKPDNIFILNNKAGRADFVKILDFGVSKFSALDSEMSMTRTGAVMGTPYYMSPEQAKGGVVDNRSDLYAIGVVLYQMVTGRVPFNASSFNELLFKIALESPEPVEQIVPDCPPSFTAIINKAMAREPEARFQSSQEFRAVLQQWAHSGAAPGVPAPTQPMPAMPDMRHPMGSSPMLAGSNPELRQSGPQFTPPLGQSGSPQAGQLAQSSPQMAPGATQHMPPGMLPLGPSGGPLGTSQAALAVTPPPKSGGKSGMVAALVGVSIAIIGAGAFGAYMLTRPATASTGEESSTPADVSTGDSGKPAAAPPPEPSDPAPSDPVPNDPVPNGGDGDPPPDKSAAPTEDPAPEPKTAPSPTPVPQTNPGPRPRPTPEPVAQPAPPPPPPPTPTPTGRKVETKL